MVDRRSDSEDSSRAKRQKMDKSGTDPRENPYLAHITQPLASCSDTKPPLLWRKRLRIMISIPSPTDPSRANTFRS
ncbi:hypothetical protein BDV12DRAFT_134855 [Aspergillus spectabilis]